MLRNTVSKVMWVGRATIFLVGLAVILALVFGVATTALAGTGVGAVLHLGKTNTVDTMTKLVGSTTSSMLVVDNNASYPALDLQVGPSNIPPSFKAYPPMKVDSEEKVVNFNADQLDGKDSSKLVNGTGVVMERTSDIAPGMLGNALFSHPTISPEVDIYYRCPSDLSNNGTLQIKNSGNETINVFSDNGNATPNAYRQLSSGQSFDQTAESIGDHITVQAQGAGVETIEVFSIHRTSFLGTGTENDCHVQAQGLWADGPGFGPEF